MGKEFRNLPNAQDPQKQIYSARGSELGKAQHHYAHRDGFSKVSWEWGLSSAGGSKCPTHSHAENGEGTELRPGDHGEGPASSQGSGPAWMAKVVIPLGNMTEHNTRLWDAALIFPARTLHGPPGSELWPLPQGSISENNRLGALAKRKYRGTDVAVQRVKPLPEMLASHEC